MGNIRKTACALAVAGLVAGCCMIAGCSPSSNADAEQQSSKSNAAEAVDFVWQPDADCATCHDKEDAEGSIASTHAALGQDCMSCHDDQALLESAHEGVTSKSLMPRKATINQDTCLSCHESYEKLAEKTADKPIVDSNGTEINPHAVPQSEEHGEQACNNCHAGHKDKEPTEYCSSCHHAGVFECYTCHE